MAKGKRFRVEPTKGKKVAPRPDEVSPDSLPPVFSLEYLGKGGFCLTDCERQEQAAFANAIYELSQINWVTIKASGRHGKGFEKITRAQIKGSIPPFFTDDIQHFLAFRFDGMKPMVGHRDRRVFYVIWLDRDFTLYNHG